MTQFHHIQKPKHYNVHPSGIECIEIARRLSFALGNALKYVWRAGLKDSAPTRDDVAKARWYLNDALKSYIYNAGNPDRGRRELVLKVVKTTTDVRAKKLFIAIEEAASTVSDKDFSAILHEALEVLSQLEE